MTPSSLAELRAWIAGGLIEEDHHTDFKAELGSTAKANRELAKDIAALAIDGGSIYLGVFEDKESNVIEVRPIELEGLRERIDQVARMRPQPSVPVSTTELVDDDDPSLGVVVIEVRPTHDSPHMVDGRYWGRSDTTNYPLPDAEVVRLHERRALTVDAGTALIEAEIARDPWEGDQLQAHLFVALQPMLPDPELLIRAMPDDTSIRQWLNHQAVKGPLGTSSGQNYSPDIGSASTVEYSRRANGAAAHSYCITPDRGVRDNGSIKVKEDDLLDLEVWEDGGVRLYCGRASDAVSTDTSALLFGALIVGLVDRALIAAREVAFASGYGGSWVVAAGLTGVRGLALYRNSMWPPRPDHRFSDDRYVGTTAASRIELETERGAVGRRVLGRFMRALDIPEGLFEEIAQRRP